jgi:hypothetical protein
MNLKIETKDLYGAKDVKEVRELLVQEQEQLDKLTLSLMHPSQYVLDHNHQNLFVRGVLNRATNSMLGKIENAFNRYIKHWYTGSLSNFLRQCASYLEHPPDERFRHPQWQKQLKVQFNKLSEGQKRTVLETFEKPDGKNGKERKAIFAKLILDRNLGYEKINDILKGVN